MPARPTPRYTLPRRLHFLGPMADWLQVNVLILGYRGYGESSGSPSERGLRCDALLALRHVAARPDVDRSKIIVFGRSIGGAVALHAASETDVPVRSVLKGVFHGKMCRRGGLGWVTV